MCRLQDSEIYRLLVSAFDPKLRSNPLYLLMLTPYVRHRLCVWRTKVRISTSSDFAPYRDAGNIDDVAYSLAELETKTRLDPSDFRCVNDFLEYDNAAALKFADDLGIEVPKKEGGFVDYYALDDIKTKNADKYQERKTAY